MEEYIRETTEFTCPNCDVSAFEVLGTHCGQEDDILGKEFLVMRCLGCLQVFIHELTAGEFHAQLAECSEAVL